MTRDPEAFLEQLFGLNELMASRHGWPRFSSWWRATLTEAETSGVQQQVIRKPRRIGASSVTAPELGVCEVLHGQHDVPPNDVGYFLFFSVTKSEAAKRLRGIRLILEALGVRHHESGDTIELLDYPFAFKVQAASFRTAVGDTAIGVWCDELARWHDADTNSNPASEVLASVKPTIATMPNAKIWLVSSPLGLLDAHAKAFELGNTSGQRVYWCRGSWLANPTLTEAQCRALEPDEKRFLREYRAEPQAALSSAFDPDGVARAFRRLVVAQPLGLPFCVVDASSGGGDAFTWTIGRWVVPARGEYVEPYLTRMVPRRVVLANGTVVFDTTEMLSDWVRDADGQPVPNPEFTDASLMPPVLAFAAVQAVEGRFAGSIAGSDIVRKIARDCKRAGVKLVVGDQREAFFLASEFKRHNLRFRPLAWTNTNKIEAVTRLKRQFAEGSIVLADDEKLKTELLNYAERITPSGAITYSARGNGHDDRAALLITSALAEIEGLTDGAPTHVSRQRHEQPLVA